MPEAAKLWIEPSHECDVLLNSKEMALQSRGRGGSHSLLRLLCLEKLIYISEITVIINVFMWSLEIEEFY